MLTKLQDRLLYLYCFAVNFQELRILGNYSVSLTAIIGIAYLVSVLPQLDRYSTINVRTGAELYLVLFAAYLICVNAVHYAPNSVGVVNVRLLTNVAFFWLFTRHLSIRETARGTAALSIAIGAASLAVFQYLGIGVEVSDTGRASLFGDNENFIGLKVATGIAIFVSTVLADGRRSMRMHWLLLLPIPAMLVLLVATGSRVAFVALTIMMLLIAALPKRTYLGRFVLLAGIVGASYFIYLTVTRNELIQARLIASVVSGDIGGRETIYASVWQAITKDWIFGIGETGYFTLFGETSPHNVILEVLSYSGIVGLMLLGASFSRIIRASVRAHSISGDLLPLLMLVPVLGMVLTGQLLTVKFGWLLLAFAASGQSQQTLSPVHPIEQPRVTETRPTFSAKRVRQKR